MVSNWFLAADKESYIPKTWLKQTYAYWKHRSERDQYYWHHQLFADAYGQDTEYRRIWDATPKLSAEGPLCFVPSRETLFKPDAYGQEDMPAGNARLFCRLRYKVKCYMNVI
jgi:hypothetical protein